MAAAATASILLTAGCGAADPAPQPGAAASASAPADTKGNTAEVCTAMAEAGREMLKGMISGALPGDGAAADPAAATRKALTSYAGKIREQAAKATDPRLRTALEGNAAAAEEVSKAPDPTDLENSSFEKSSKELEALCKDPLTPTAKPGTPTTRVGVAGSPCRLPVAFDLVPLWKPKALDIPKDDELASLYRNGPFSAVCEIDAKPAGNIGFLRVYTAPDRKGSPRRHLEAFLAGENPEGRKAGNFKTSKIKYTDIEVGGQPASEVTYETYNKTMEHASKYSAFAVNTPRGAVVVKLSPFGADEHAEILPAFELAKRTLTVNR